MSDFLISKLSSSFSLSFSSSIIFCDSYNWKSFLLASYVVFWNGILLFQFNKKMHICCFNSIKKSHLAVSIQLKMTGVDVAICNGKMVLQVWSMGDIQLYVVMFGLGWRTRSSGNKLTWPLSQACLAPSHLLLWSHSSWWVSTFFIPTS
jgi:hypothetical protein